MLYYWALDRLESRLQIIYVLRYHKGCSMKDLVSHTVKFSPYIGFMTVLYLSLLVGAVLGVCAIALVAHLLHNFFHNPTVWDAIVWSRYFH